MFSDRSFFSARKRKLKLLKEKKITYSKNKFWYDQRERSTYISQVQTHDNFINNSEYILKMANETKLILQKLEKIEKNVEQIKEHMIDADAIMTEEDYEALLEYRREKSEGKLVSHDELKKELEL